ncbi:hypothetical protein PtA15_13A116 [Puccinia triticina]|uniref:Uncharacterized protein n=1 Tax=Puccinia triticina TaxID=208348 RepID=A0ABY7D723_9BASI|nr:uncharacterized protein PtA15_13A116 [Puccinia triticina]WAQ90717.1 hypothetical protein PtA15_13A116 [Puccinia triticina]
MAQAPAAIPFFWPHPQSNNPQNMPHNNGGGSHQTNAQVPRFPAKISQLPARNFNQIPAENLLIPASFASLDLSQIPANHIRQFLADHGLLPLLSPNSSTPQPLQPFTSPDNPNYLLVQNPTTHLVPHPTSFDFDSPSNNSEGSNGDAFSKFRSDQSSRILGSGSDSGTSP